MVQYADTIYALSSGAPPSGVAIIRLSGPSTRFGLETLIGQVPAPRHATLAMIRRRDGTPIDKGLALYFQGPSSFTGEDCAELHIHGGRAVIAALLSELGGIAGLRAAEPGEFTRRAFENGRIDLTEVEGLADLIGAETEAQRRMALENARGGLSAIYAQWAERLIRCRARIEADLDFADEEDVPDDAAQQALAELLPLRAEIANHLVRGQAAEIVRDGFRIAIAGAPNAGKSSLMNALARRDVSIVSAEAGTTRDVVTVHLDLGGYCVIISDTAGIREAAGEVEAEGIRRAQDTIAGADLVLHLTDLSVAGTGSPVLPGTVKVLRIGTKRDLAKAICGAFDVTISTVTGDGISVLLALIQQHVEAAADATAGALPTRIRQRQHLEHCLRHLDDVLSASDAPLEVRAEGLRLAGDALGRLTGRVDVEDLLGVIFSEFCIGK